MPNLLAAAISPPYDPRSVCNLILDEADYEGRQITNLALQKLLYFAHGHHLVETKRPLVTGFFEAWRYGPVHPIAYSAFRSAGGRPIAFRGAARDPFTDAEIPLQGCADSDARLRVRRIVRLYGGMTAGRLVDVAHAPGAPWHFIVDKARTETILGLRIPDDVIASRFKYHKVSVGAQPRHGEPREDAPLV